MITKTPVTGTHIKLACFCVLCLEITTNILRSHVICKYIACRHYKDGYSKRIFATSCLILVLKMRFFFYFLNSIT